MTTGTASSKTLCFHLAAMEALAALPKTKVIVHHPQKALGAEQMNRWRRACRAASLDLQVGRIDRQVTVPKREAVLERCRVVILTPGAHHA